MKLKVKIRINENDDEIPREVLFHDEFPHNLDQIYPVSRAIEGRVYALFFKAEEVFTTIEEHVGGGLLTFTPERCARINEKLDEILNGLHEENMYICDLSPESVLYNYDTEEIKLINFENSIMSEDSNVELTRVYGPTSFHSPEQVLWSRGEINEPPKARDVDMWCKANIIYYCLYGRFAFDSSKKIVYEKLSFPSDKKVSEDIKKLLLEMFDKEVGKRPHNRREETEENQ